SINGLLTRIRQMMDRQRRFIADAAHELRTPITALSLQAENLEPVPLSDEARGRLETLRHGMRRTRHLLEQLLALARYEGMPFDAASPARLDQVAKEVVADLMPDAAHRGVDVGFAVVEPIATGGDEVMIAAMIRNLIDNAVRFTQKGGRVDIGI